jgi:hypothetical protein
MQKSLAISKTSIELFVYPWDIVDRGIDRFVEECRELGVNVLHVTTLYHSGKFLLPRNSTSRVYFPDPGNLFVRLPKGAFKGGVSPAVSKLAGTGWLEKLANSAAKARMGLAGWTVFHHSTSLGTKHPELATRNIFGDSYPFALCPSNPAVRQFSISLAGALARVKIFESLDLETIGYLGYYHGHHHEVTAVPAGPLEHFLLSLCFCKACMDAGKRARIPMEPLRAQLRALLLEKLRCDDACTRSPDNMEQLATLLALSEPLQNLVRLRIKTVSSLIHQIRDATNGLKLSGFTSSFIGSPSNIWMEGLSLPELKDVIDAFHLLAYTSDTDRVNEDLVLCRAQVEDPARLNLTLNLGLPVTPSLGHAMAKIDFAWRQGVRRFSFFNYGFLGAGRLSWLGEISAALRKKES